MIENYVNIILVFHFSLFSTQKLSEKIEDWHNVISKFSFIHDALKLTELNRDNEEPRHTARLRERQTGILEGCNHTGLWPMCCPRIGSRITLSALSYNPVSLLTYRIF